jgi:hypothetical protein
MCRFAPSINMNTQRYEHTAFDVMMKYDPYAQNRHNR